MSNSILTADHIALMLGYHCGLRLGEAFGIVWDDIDLKNRVLKINRQVQWKNDLSRTDTDKAATNGTNESGNGYWYFVEPKYASYRIIDLDDTIVALLKREKERQDRSKDYYSSLYTRYFVQNPLLVSGLKPNSQPPVNPIAKTGPIEIHLLNVREDGSYITPRTMQHTSSVIHKKLEYKEFDYHSLRHTHATMLTEQGAPLVYIQHRLGHSKLDVTANIYTNHMTEAIMKQGNHTINSMF